MPGPIPLPVSAQMIELEECFLIFAAAHTLPAVVLYRFVSPFGQKYSTILVLIRFIVVFPHISMNMLKLLNILTGRHLISYAGKMHCAQL